MNAQDLKNSILQLAIQGKLVEQREEEGTAKELLEQIKAAKDQLIKEKKIKKEKSLPEITDDEIPFDIPKNWEWVRLSSVIQIINGDRGKNYPSKDKLTDKGIPFISALNIENRTISKEKLLYMNEEQYEKLGSGKLKLGDVALCIRGSLGKNGRYPFEKGAIASSLVILRSYFESDDYYEFIMQYINSGLFTKEVAKYNNGTAQPNLGARDLAKFIVPLPPLEEQKRIVAKIEELMPYVEKYDVAYSEVEELNKKFPEDMKKSILQYAIQGKLIEQREEEGTAEELYQRIQEEKKKLIKDGKIKKGKPSPLISEDEVPFDIPKSWKWVRIADIIDSDLGGGTPSKHNPSYWNGKIPWMSVKDYVNNPNGIEDTLEKITENGLNNSSSNLIPAGNIIVCTRVGLGKIAINNVDIAINQDLRALFLSKFINKNYFIYYYNRLNIIGMGTTVKGIKREELLQYLFPLPPLEEQKRIVEKIEELLPYTKQLVK